RGQEKTILSVQPIFVARAKEQAVKNGGLPTGGPSISHQPYACHPDGLAKPVPKLYRSSGRERRTPACRQAVTRGSILNATPQARAPQVRWRSRPPFVPGLE